MKIKRESGVTLISLVVSIILLLILSGVSLSLTLGENGILVRTKEAKVKYDVASAKEYMEILATTFASDYLEDDSNTDNMVDYMISKFRTVDKVEDYNLDINGKQIILNNKDGTEVAKGILKNNGGIKWIDANSKLTLGQVYSNNMIGKEISYKSDNNYSDWIIFGPELDENGNRTGNVLAATKEPIANKYVLNANAKAAAHYTLKEGETGFDAKDEDNNFLSLNRVCMPYSGTAQGKEIKARSITLEDINYVVGYTKPNSFYTFCTENNYKDILPFYYVSMLGANRTDDIAEYLVKPGEVLNGETVPNKQIQASYSYQKNVPTLTKSENMKYIIGENENDMYMVSSLTVSGDGYKTTSITNFNMAAVHDGGVDGYFARACYTSSVPGNDYGNMDGKDKMNTAIRPVVVLPADLEVEEISEGVYDIK